MQKYIALFRKHLLLMLGVGALVLIPALLIVMTRPPEYTATARLLLDGRRDQVLDAKQMVTAPAVDAKAADTEVQVLRSRAIADAVVSRLKLDQAPVRQNNGPLASIRRAVGLEKKPASDPAASPHERAVDELMRAMKVERPGDTSVIDVSVEAGDPVEAATLANTVTAVYLERQLENKAQATVRANEWLNSKLAGLRDQVLAADAAVQSYRAQHGLITAGSSTVVEQDISNLNGQLATARANQAEQDARLANSRLLLARGGTGEDLGESLSSPVIAALRGQRAQLGQQAADLQTRYGPKHPEVLKVQGQLADLNQQIQAEVKRIVANVEGEARVARQRTASIAGSLSSVRGQLAANANATVRLDELLRNQEAVRATYQSYLDRFRQTSAQQGVEQADARLISRAKPPASPSAPNVPKGLAISFALAFMAAAGSMFAAETLESGLSTSNDVEEQLGIASLPSIPLLSSTIKTKNVPHPVDYVVDKPLSAFTESFRNLRTRVSVREGGGAVRVLTITSALPGEGKTTTSICLGRTAALSGLNVIVVDCDLRRRSLADWLNRPVEHGLLEVLNGESTLEQALISDKRSGATLLALSPETKAHIDVFGSEAFDKLLSTLRERYDLVLLDAPPVLPVADARVIARKSDAVALLARWRKTPRRAVEAALRELEAADAPLMGVSLTQVDVIAQSRSGYGDSGYYYQSYRKYYLQ